jgi:uncharacterized Zn-binding protein involved in type VI secretion
MEALAAARLGDEICHGAGILGMIAGAIVGAVAAVVVVGIVAATGGLAIVIFAGAIAGGALFANQILKGVKTIFKLDDPTSGVLTKGSTNVFTNSRPAIRATLDGALACSGGSFPFVTHMPLPMFGAPDLIRVAEGSKTVTINSMPASRVTMMLVCSAKIKTGSQNVFIGGPTARTEFVWDITSWLETGFTWLGYAAMGGAAILAAMAGVAALATFAAVTATMMVAFEALGRLGDAIGPGYRDLFQGIAGMGLLLASPKMARMGTGNNTATLSADDVRFSQNTVSYNKTDRVTGTKYTYDDLVQSMKRDGWKGDPVDVVKMPDGKLTSMDNTRIAAAREAGIDIKANVHNPNDPLPPDVVASGRFGEARTWGEALTNRINNQKPGSFGTENPNGSPNPPRITGKPKP